jgi:protease I
MFKKLGIVMIIMGVVLAMTVGCFAAAKKQKQILMVIAPKEFKDNELFEPKTIFEIFGAKVTVASTTIDTVVGMDGYKFKPELNLADVKIEDYDAIVISGGNGAQELFDNQDLHKMAREFYNQKKLVAAMCISPAILAKAGLLKGIKATTYPWDVPVNILKDNGAIYVDQVVCVSGNIITGRDPNAAKEFGLAISKALGIRK